MKILSLYVAVFLVMLKAYAPAIGVELTPTGVPGKPWASSTAAGYENSAKAIILSDMGQCLPQSALADSLQEQKWKLMAYATTSNLTGRMVWASRESDSPELCLKIRESGYHAIFVGLYAGAPAVKVLLKLDSDKVFQIRSTGGGASFRNIEEVFFKVAKLDNSSLRLKPGNFNCGLAYVKLVPLSQAEADKYEAELQDKSNRKMAATYDGLEILYGRQPRERTVEALLRSLEGFRNTDFGTVLLQYGGADQAPYPSKVASSFGYYATDKAYPENPAHREYMESYREFAERKINPYKVLIDGCHDLGLNVQVSMRPAMWTFWEPYCDFFDSRFFRDHPEWRTVDKDGTPVTRMSWAVPQVRIYLLNVLREAVELGADGVNILFNRGFPVVLYEPAFVEAFKKEYPAVDPKTLDDLDPRIIKVRSDIIAGFMKQVRIMLDEEAARRNDGKKLILSAGCLGNEHDNIQYGLDIKRLVNDGLLDEVYPYKFNHGATKCVWDIKYFAGFCKPKGVRLSPVFSPGYEFNTQVKDAVSFYNDGADSISYWDAFGGWANMQKWCVMSRMGRFAELQERGAVPGQVFINLRQVNGIILNGKYPPYMGG